MTSSKIQDESEVRRWMVDEGRTYRWMVEEYRRKYNIETTISMWGNHRRSRGYELRIARDMDLIPWHVMPQHEQKYPVAMLRFEARRRMGMDITPEQEAKLVSWLDKMSAEDLVVHYDPDTDEGFFVVPRRIGVDTDLIRRPDRKSDRHR